MRSKFDSNPSLAGSNPAQWMQYCFFAKYLRKSKSSKEEASTRYWHIHQTDFTDSSVGRAESCSVRSKFDSNP